MKKLDGKVAVITGGAGGIGLGIATAFVKDGAKVAIVDLDKDKGNEALKSLREHGEESIFIHANLAERNNLPRIIKEVV